MYEDYPHTQWRMLFMQIEDQLTEIDGEYADEADMDGDGDDEGEAKAKNRKAKKRSPEFGQIEIDE